MSSNSTRATSEARKPRRTNTSNTAASRHPRPVAVSQPATSRLACAAGIADGNAVRGQHLSAGTAATKGTETRPVTYRNRKKQRSAVTRQRSDGVGITCDAARTVVQHRATIQIAEDNLLIGTPDPQESGHPGDVLLCRRPRQPT